MGCLILFLPELSGTALGHQLWAPTSDQHLQLQGQGDSLLQTEVPKPAGIICSAAPETVASLLCPVCLTYHCSPGRLLGQGFQTLCSKSWNRESSEVKGLTYDLLFYIAFSLLFANYWCQYLSMLLLPFSLSFPHLDLSVRARVLPVPQNHVLAKSPLKNHSQVALEIHRHTCRKRGHASVNKQLKTLYRLMLWWIYRWIIVDEYLNGLEPKKIISDLSRG